MISHNHYDHLDRNTLQEIYTKHAKRPPPLFIGLGGGQSVSDIVPKEIIAELDWWEDRELAVEGKGRARITASELDCSARYGVRQVLMITAPAQHESGRGLFDKKRALWASWAFQSLDKAGDVGASVSQSALDVP